MGLPDRIGRWKIDGLLGSGGVAEVFLGTIGEGAERVEVAVKRTLPERVRQPGQGPAFDEALRAEGRLLSCLLHPNVVGFVELIESAGPALALERLHGRTLAEVQHEQREGRLPLELVIEIGAQAAAALSAVHSVTDEAGRPLEAVHRDVAPDNLFVTREGAIKLFDFNVACFVGAAIPASGALQGRVAYMAPEQARGEPVRAPADIFSLAVVIWELAVGARLFWRGSVLSTLRALVDEPIPSLRERAQLPGPLEALLEEMLARDPAVRPSARVVEARLRTFALPDAGLRARLAGLADTLSPA